MKIDSRSTTVFFVPLKSVSIYQNPTSTSNAFSTYSFGLSLYLVSPGIMKPTHLCTFTHFAIFLHFIRSPFLSFLVFPSQPLFFHFRLVFLCVFFCLEFPRYFFLCLLLSQRSFIFVPKSLEFVHLVANISNVGIWILLLSSPCVCAPILVAPSTKRHRWKLIIICWPVFSGYSKELAKVFIFRLNSRSSRALGVSLSKSLFSLLFISKRVRFFCRNFLIIVFYAKLYLCL